MRVASCSPCSGAPRSPRTRTSQKREPVLPPSRSEAEVDRVLGEAVAAGGSLRKPGQKVFWGGYSGYFADPDGHLWEVAYNPHFPLDDMGRLVLPP